MNCKNCGSLLELKNGVAVCDACNSTYKVDNIFEDIDVHICYVESDSNGRRTKDSIVAQEIFQKLEAKKVNTFYERISASNIIGDELDLVKYSSLSAAKIVLVVGTTIDNFNFILEKYGQYISDKTIIPFVADIKASEIPNELSKIQALDFSSIGWENDLESAVFRILGREKELDLLNCSKRSKKIRNVILSVVAGILLLTMCAFGVLYLNNLKKSDEPVQQSNQEIYNNAQNLLVNKRYLEAYDLFSSILDYKDSKQQVETILNRYDGYYQTSDKKFSINFDIKNATELLLEMSTESLNGTSKANIEGVWSGKEQTYSFTDTFGNVGVVTITLKNEAISIVVQMEKTGDFASIGNQNVEFKLSDKTDKPAILQVTSELLLSWLKTPTTADDITSLGFELERDNNSEITAGGGVLSNANLYRIANTDIQLFFYAKDLSNQKVLYENGGKGDKQIVCAVFANAEYLLPNKINNSCEVYIEDDTLFVPGGSLMEIDWGGTDIFIQFATREELSSNKSIKVNTKVGAVCKKIVGNGFFVRNVLLHKKINEDDGYLYSGPMILETTDGYVLSSGRGEAYKINKKTYEIMEIMELFEFHVLDNDYFYVQDNDYIIYSEPSYESKALKTLPAGQYYCIETSEDKEGKLWGKVIDTSGWICLTDKQASLIFR